MYFSQLRKVRSTTGDSEHGVLLLCLYVAERQADGFPKVKGTISIQKAKERGNLLNPFLVVVLFCFVGWMCLNVVQNGFKVQLLVPHPPE